MNIELLYDGHPADGNPAGAFIRGAHVDEDKFLSLLRLMVGDIVDKLDLEVEHWMCEECEDFYGLAFEPGGDVPYTVCWDDVVGYKLSNIPEEEWPQERMSDAQN